MRAAVGDVAEPVRLVLQRADAPRRLGVRVDALDGSVAALLGLAADERERAAVRRPGELGDAELAVGDLHRFAAGRVHHEQLRRSLRAGTEEREQPAVGRELRSRVAETAGEPSGRGMSGQRNGPQLADGRVGRRGRDGSPRRRRVRRPGCTVGAETLVSSPRSAAFIGRSAVKLDTSPTRRVWSAGIGSTTACGDLGSELAHVVELAGRLLARVDRAGVEPVQQRRRDGALDHVAGDDDEVDALLGERRDAGRAARPRRRAC